MTPAPTNTPLPTDRRWFALAWMGLSAAWMVVLPWTPGISVWDAPYGPSHASRSAADWAEMLSVWMPVGAWGVAVIAVLALVAMLAGMRQRHIPTQLSLAVLLASAAELLAAAATLVLIGLADNGTLEMSGSPWPFLLASASTGVSASWLWKIGCSERRRASAVLDTVNHEQHRNAGDIVVGPET